MLPELEGVFDVLFVGDSEPRRIHIAYAVVDVYSRPLFLRDVDNVTIYNWSTITQLTKVED